MEKPSNKSQVRIEAIAYRPREAGLAGAVSERTIREAVANGEIAACHIGNGKRRRHIVILPADLIAWLRSRRVPVGRTRKE